MKSRAGSSALMRTSIAWPRRGARPVSDERLARGDAQLLADEVDARDQLGDRVLDLEAGVQLDEVERAVGREQELERAGVAVAEPLARALGGRLHRLAALRRERRRRRLLDQLLVAPLDRALALAEREHAAVRVAEHLDLDVARGRDHLLDVDASRRRRQPPPRPRRVAYASASSSGAVDAAHAAPAAAGDRLQQHGVARPRPATCRASASSTGPALPGTSGTSAARISPSRCALSPMRAIVSGSGPTKTRSLSAQASAKAGFSARKPQPGMHGLAAGRHAGGDHGRDVEVAAARPAGGPMQHGAVGHADVQRVRVGGRVDGDRLGADLVQRADDAHRDLAAVRDQNPC